MTLTVDLGYCFAAWKDAFRLIKRLHPDARVAGPNSSILYEEVKGFLEFAKAHGVLPDVITWHELSTPAEIRANVAKYRRMERESGIGPRPVNINEYAHNHHLSVPGRIVRWISAIEESKIDADTAYWNIDGNLNDSAVEVNKGNGQWWLFNAYGRMTGHTVRVTAPRPGVEHTLQGVATLDRHKRQARLLFGGENGAADIVFAQVPAEVFGDALHVRLHEIPWTGQVGASARPLRLQDRELPVVDGTAILSLSDQDPTNVFLRVDEADPRELRLPLGYKRAVWGHTDTRVRLTVGKHTIRLAARDPDLGVTKGDAIIDRLDLALRDERGSRAVRGRVRGARRWRAGEPCAPRGLGARRRRAAPRRHRHVLGARGGRRRGDRDGGAIGPWRGHVDRQRGEGGAAGPDSAVPGRRTASCSPPPSTSTTRRARPGHPSAHSCAPERPCPSPPHPPHARRRPPPAGPAGRRCAGRPVQTWAP